jgi:hypothetical protein
MSQEDTDKALSRAAKGFRKAQVERAALARRCFTRAKNGDKGWSDLLHAGDDTLVGILASQAFRAGYMLACKHLGEAGDSTAGLPDAAAKCRGTYTTRELDAMGQEEQA